MFFISVIHTLQAAANIKIYTMFMFNITIKCHLALDLSWKCWSTKLQSLKFYIHWISNETLNISLSNVQTIFICFVCSVCVSEHFGENVKMAWLCDKLSKRETIQHMRKITNSFCEQTCSIINTINIAVDKIICQTIYDNFFVLFCFSFIHSFGFLLLLL